MRPNVINNKKGFTLVEVIVSIGLLLIVTALAFSLLAFGNNTFDRSSKQYQMQSDVRLVLDSITKKVNYSNELNIMSVSTCESQILSIKPYNYIYVKGSKVYNYVFHSTPTAGYDISLIPGAIADTGTSFSKGTKNYDLIITLTAQTGQQTYTAQSQVKLINFKLMSPVPVIQVESPAVNPLLAIRYK